MEKNEETTARKLSQPERHDRYQRQLKRLTGVSIKGPTEPSDALVDLCCTNCVSLLMLVYRWEESEFNERLSNWPVCSM